MIPHYTCSDEDLLCIRGIRKRKIFRRKEMLIRRMSKKSMQLVGRKIKMKKRLQKRRKHIMNKKNHKWRMKKVLDIILTLSRSNMKI